MNVERISEENREELIRFLAEHWFTTKMIVRGTEVDMTKTEGFLVRADQEIIGLVTYLVRGKTAEIMSLDSLREGRGIGTALVNVVIGEAKKRGCGKIVLITTNDNINAIRFYQKRGFDMARFFRNAVDRARELKPEIPLIGENSIPLRHEIEFELIL